MGELNVAWSELFGDEEREAEFDRERRDEPPWFGFVPRVLAVNLARPYQPRLALWRDGAVVECKRLTVDRRRLAGSVRPLLALVERLADYCRERGLFGAYLALYDFAADAPRAAVTAAVMREADWCGMLVCEPVPYRPRRGVDPAAALACDVAARLAAGETAPAAMVARFRAGAATSRPDTRRRIPAPAAPAGAGR